MNDAREANYRKSLRKGRKLLEEVIENSAGESRPPTPHSPNNPYPEHSALGFNYLAAGHGETLEPEEEVVFIGENGIDEARLYGPSERSETAHYRGRGALFTERHGLKSSMCSEKRDFEAARARGDIDASMSFDNWMTLRFFDNTLGGEMKENGDSPNGFQLEDIPRSPAHVRANTDAKAFWPDEFYCPDLKRGKIHPPHGLTIDHVGGQSGIIDCHGLSPETASLLDEVLKEPWSGVSEKSETAGYGSILKHISNAGSEDGEPHVHTHTNRLADGEKSPYDYDSGIPWTMLPGVRFPGRYPWGSGHGQTVEDEPDKEDTEPVDFSWAPNKDFGVLYNFTGYVSQVGTLKEALEVAGGWPSTKAVAVKWNHENHRWEEIHRDQDFSINVDGPVDKIDWSSTIKEWAEKNGVPVFKAPTDGVADKDNPCRMTPKCVLRTLADTCTANGTCGEYDQVENTLLDYAKADVELTQDMSRLQVGDLKDPKAPTITKSDVDEKVQDRWPLKAMRYSDEDGDTSLNDGEVVPLLDNGKRVADLRWDVHDQAFYIVDDVAKPDVEPDVAGFAVRHKESRRVYQYATETSMNLVLETYPDDYERVWWISTAKCWSNSEQIYKNDLAIRNQYTAPKDEQPVKTINGPITLLSISLVTDPIHKSWKIESVDADKTRRPFEEWAELGLFFAPGINVRGSQKVERVNETPEETPEEKRERIRGLNEDRRKWLNEAVKGGFDRIGVKNRFAGTVTECESLAEAQRYNSSRYDIVYYDDEDGYWYPIVGYTSRDNEKYEELTGNQGPLPRDVTFKLPEGFKPRSDIGDRLIGFTIDEAYVPKEEEDLQYGVRSRINSVVTKVADKESALQFAKDYPDCEAVFKTPSGFWVRVMR